MRPYKRITLLLFVLACLLCSGCFDLETEVRFLEDGSGFMTCWVRMDYANVAAAAAMSRTSVEEWTAEVIEGIDQVFWEVPGIRLIDRDIFRQSGKIVLRYRFAFDDTARLNDFLADPALEEQLIYPAKGRFAFAARPGQCGGDYSASFSFGSRKETIINQIGYRDIDKLPVHEREPILEKFYSGNFAIRLALPGASTVSDAPIIDGRGYPVYRYGVLDFFRKGAKGGGKSKVVCEKGQKKTPDDFKELSAEPITIGATSTPFELVKGISSIPNYLDVLFIFDCDEKGRVKQTIIFVVDEPLKGPFEFYFPLLMAAFPVIEGEYDYKMEPSTPGTYRYRFEMKNPVKPSKLGSKLVYYDKRKNHFAFRMVLPQMKFGEPPAPNTAAGTLVRVKVDLPANVRVSNASEIDGKTAYWTITDAMVKNNKVTLEALSE